MANYSSASVGSNLYGGVRGVQLDWYITNQNINNNTTTIHWTLHGSGSGGSSWYMSGNFKVILNGQTVYYSTGRVQLWSNTVVAQGDFTVSHNDAGAGSLSAHIEAGVYTYAVNVAGDGSWWFPDIARTSHPSIITYPNTTTDIGNIGDTVAIHMNRHSTSFTHTVSYSFGNLHNKVIATGVTDNLRWTIPQEFYSQLSNTSGGGYIYVDTYNGGTKIGTADAWFIVHVPNSSAPTFTAGYKDADSATVRVTNDNQQLVQSKSRLYIQVSNISFKNGASLAKVTVTINGVTKTYTDIKTGNLDWGVVDFAANTSAVVTVTDSRNMSASKTLSLRVKGWNEPDIFITAQRNNNYYNSTTVSVDVRNAVGDNKNTIIRVRWKKESDSVSAYNTNGFRDLTSGEETTLELDNKYEWILQVTVTDPFGIQTVKTQKVLRGTPIVFIDNRKNSVGVNCLPQHANSFEINGIDLVSLFTYSKNDIEAAFDKYIAAGYLSQNGTEIHFNVHLGKSMNYLIPRVTAFSANFRDNNGNYMMEGSYSAYGVDVYSRKDVEITTKKINENDILFVLKAPTGFVGHQNNAPVTIEFKTLEIIFE